ncbi:MAG TPA: sugar-binding protein, partial [Armatimonadota bacterium]|nr:sugar-binding protein [Armatimonadota bacterium]
VYYTEFGWTTVNGTWQKPVDELTQARYVSRSIALLSTTKYSGLCYFCLLYHAKGNPGEGGFSLLHDDGTPKPGIVAFATLTRWLGGIKGEGCWLTLTPTTNMALFRRDKQTIAMLWTAEGQSTFKLPVMPTKQQDMMGRDIPIPTNAIVALTPSPIYLEIPGQALCNLTKLPGVTVQPGGQLPLPWQRAVVPAPLTKAGRTVHIPLSAPLGSYTILGKSANGWQVLPVTVANSFVIESTQMSPDTQRKSIQLRIAAHSYMAAPTTIHATVLLSQGQRLASTPMKVPAYNTATLSIPLASLDTNQRYQGTVTINAINGKPYASQPISFTLFACKAVATGTTNWSQLPSLDFSHDAPVICLDTTQTCKPFMPADCSATIKTAYDDSGLQLQIRVRDNQHVQKQIPESMWKEDSIQLGFDSDADQEWRANDLGFGFNGHRIFEYGIALGEQGPMVWRWLAYYPNLRANMTESRVQTNITREGDITLYTVNFPWATLGLSAKPKTGSSIGFSLVVNDADRDAAPSVPSMTRHGLRLFKGIIESKDFTQYGRLWFR